MQDVNEAAAKHNWLLRTLAWHSELAHEPKEQDCGEFKCDSLDYYERDTPQLPRGLKVDITIWGCRILDGDSTDIVDGPHCCYLVAVVTAKRADEAAALQAVAAQLVWLPAGNGCATLTIPEEHLCGLLHLFVVDVRPDDSLPFGPKRTGKAAGIPLSTDARLATWCDQLPMKSPLWYYGIPLSQAMTQPEPVEASLELHHLLPHHGPAPPHPNPSYKVKTPLLSPQPGQHVAGVRVVPGLDPHRSTVHLTGVEFLLDASCRPEGVGQGLPVQSIPLPPSEFPPKDGWSRVAYVVRKRTLRRDAAGAADVSADEAVDVSALTEDVLAYWTLPAFHCFLCPMRTQCPLSLLYHLTTSHPDLTYKMQHMVEPGPRNPLHPLKLLLFAVSRKKDCRVHRTPDGAIAIVPPISESVMPTVVLGLGDLQPRALWRELAPVASLAPFTMDQLACLHVPRAGAAWAQGVLAKWEYSRRFEEPSGPPPVVDAFQRWGVLWTRFLLEEEYDGSALSLDDAALAFTRIHRAVLASSPELSKAHASRLMLMAQRGRVAAAVVGQCVKMLKGLAVGAPEGQGGAAAGAAQPAAAAGGNASSMVVQVEGQ